MPRGWKKNAAAAGLGRKARAGSSSRKERAQRDASLSLRHGRRARMSRYDTELRKRKYGKV